GDRMKGIEGYWLTNPNPYGSHFRIEFDNDTMYGTDPVWMSVKVIPEPATLLLVACGGLLIRRKRM
ncbi:MAG: hypothetical protein LLF76_14255, partial [Planctomycetaceae bacterium]|nr:hypothetical protein [Planctomycetaceae bacterium]